MAVGFAPNSFGEPHALVKLAPMVIRTFRNAVVHNLEVGRFYINDRIYIPKPELIGELRDWSKLFAIQTLEEFDKKCVLAVDRMTADILQLESVLDQIWMQTLIPEFTELFYEPVNSSLRQMYDIEFE